MQWVIAFVLMVMSPAWAVESCERRLATTPRQVSAAQTFEALVDWIHSEIILKRHAPGLVIGLSGTDSILAFLASVRAFERVGLGHRVAGIHYSQPNEVDWFAEEVLPWLRSQAPQATILIDHSVDPKRDGLRWGALLEWSVIQDPATGVMRPPQERYWVVGTRNATEMALMNFSNISGAASVQPLQNLYKSEVLSICEYLDVPQAAIQKSCEEDCVCGRDQIAAAHIHEIDALLMVRAGEVSESYVEATIPHDLKSALEEYIETQIQQAAFKKNIPYVPDVQSVVTDTFEFAGSVSEVSRQLPKAIAGRWSSVVADFVSRDFREELLPEMLALLNTPGITLNQKRMMLRRIFRSDFSLGETKLASDVSARLGYYGFSFPQWRFLSQRYGDQTSLAEQYGMKRLSRINDFRDASLPPSDPQRDEWGVGFLWETSEWYVEYRRAYIVCSNKKGATVIIRNNSHFFGRDRLPQPVYISMDSWSTQQLINLSPSDLSHFSLLEEISPQQMRSILVNINYLDKFNYDMNQWLVHNHKLEDFQQTFAGQVFLGAVRGAEPSWWPRALSGGAEGLREGERLVLMSGRDGDLP